MAKEPNSSKVHRQLTSARGTVQLRELTLGEYLERTGMRNEQGTVALAPKYQAHALELASNPIKQEMLRNVLHGALLPALTVLEGPGSAWEIIDGVQRTDVLVHAVRLLAESPSDTGDDSQRELVDEERPTLSLDALLARPVFLQVFADLEPEEKVGLFAVLNSGHQQRSPRDLLVLLRDDLGAMFESWGVMLMTEAEEKALPKRRSKRMLEGMGLPSMMHYRSSSLIAATLGYVSGDPQIQTRKSLDEPNLAGHVLGERLVQLGSTCAKSDFQAVCLGLNRAVNRRYADTPKWRSILQISDNVLIPVMAAVGTARARADLLPNVERRLGWLTRHLEDADDPDPLRFYTTSRSLDAAFDRVTSNIGRTQRSIVYESFLDFLSRGGGEEGPALNWFSHQSSDGSKGEMR